MAEIAVNNKSITDFSAALANLAQLFDNVQKSTDSYSKTLQEATAALGGAANAVVNASKESDKPRDRLLAQLKTLKGSNVKDIEAALGVIYSLALESGSAVEMAVARADTLLTTGKISLDEYIDNITSTVEGLKSSEEAATRLSASIASKAEAARKKLEEFPENSILGLMDTFVDAVVNKKDVGAAMSAKLKQLGTDLLNNIVESMLRDVFDLSMGKKDAQAFGSGVTGLFNNLSGIFSSTFSNIFNNIFSVLFGAFNGVFNGISSIFSSIFGIFNAQGNVFGPQGLERFARGGIVSQPTLFPFARGIGLMGEAGAEAIMPLGRDSRGNLGVRVADSAMNGAGGVFAPHVEINVENKGGGDMTEEQARVLGAQVKAVVEMQVAKQMYEYARSGILRPSAGMGY